MVTFLAAVVTVFVLIAVFGLGAWFSLDGPGPLGHRSTIILRKGAGVSEMGAELQRAHVVGSSTLFKVAAEMSGADRKLKAGEYNFPAHVALGEVIRKMAAGEVVRHFVTVPEGWTSAQAVAVLRANPALSGALATPPEGSLLPDTYEFTRGDSRADLIAKMQAARDSVLADLWAHRKPGLPFNTPEQAVILASIVEKETATQSERLKIAGVFVNRLKKGMKLESDPTIVYGITKGEVLGHGIRASEKASATPYNTYVITGLPPTPICNPGRAALAAVTNPEDTDALFFVANGSGGSSFAATQAQHDKNVAAWRQIEAQRKAAQTPFPPPGHPNGPIAPNTAVPAPRH
ncbi:MAG TPA: endolytic transglycosylase MltG [Caulobacteraceae bacterium]|nr:endolytic transglycosylase MltG [Caulobacteraceae bacterium]